MSLRSYIEDQSFLKIIYESTINDLKKELQEEKRTRTALEKMNARYNKKGFFTEDKSYISQKDTDALSKAYEVVNKIVSSKEFHLKDLQSKYKKQESNIENMKNKLIKELNKYNKEKVLKYIVIYYNTDTFGTYHGFKSQLDNFCAKLARRAYEADKQIIKDIVNVTFDYLDKKYLDKKDVIDKDYQEYFDELNDEKEKWTSWNN